MTADLPKGKSIQDIFADFIRYLFDSVKAFIQESEPTGKELWESLEPNIDLILSHPNGWEGREQEFLRKSVVQASVFTEEEALSRVSFVTEGEATFNFCVTNTKSGKLLEVVVFPFSSKIRSDRSFQAWTQGFGRRCWRRNRRCQLLHCDLYVAIGGGRVSRTKM
jgi:hypothetical protein